MPAKNSDASEHYTAYRDRAIDGIAQVAQTLAQSAQNDLQADTDF